MRRRFVVISLAVVVAACSSTDEAASNPASTLAVATPLPSTTQPVATSTPAPAVPEVIPQGFELVAATVTKADGETCDVCLWLADTAEQRARGLMNVTDLGNADGMAFVYPTAHTGNFWMKNTLLPLSIAFFGSDGDHLGEFDMDPCIADPCPRYRTARDFVVAVEARRGELAEIGIGPGSSIELSGLPCS